MLDFVLVKTISTKRGHIDIFPEFIVKKSKDLMIRGHSFYAIWDDEQGFWSRSESDAVRLIDEELYRFYDENQDNLDGNVSLKLLKNFSSKKWLEFQNYCRSCPDNYHDLDVKMTFSDSKVRKTDYVSKTLPYSLSKSKCPAYDELIGTLYSEEDREKLEWVMGAVLSGDSKQIQKFLVLYGSPGSGKSTILRIMEKLFEGYWIPFDSKSLGSLNNSFALEIFRSNPLVAIQHEGDLSRIDDNTRINSIVSHESMVVNEKFKTPYSLEFNTFLILATNKPVRITDAKSGLIRRMIDVSPTGNRVDGERYDYLTEQINFEIGSIANHCLKVYKNLGKKYYDRYIPVTMIGETNDFYNFMEDNYDLWTIDYPNGITLNVAWRRYKDYCEDANIPYPYKKIVFKAELKNYFREFHERYNSQYNVYTGFIKEKFDYEPKVKKIVENFTENDNDKIIYISQNDYWLSFNRTKSLFDEQFSDCFAQYANSDGKPIRKWIDISTKLSELDTTKVHYVRLPLQLIVIDFDIKNEKGEKDFQLNLEAASKWPETYAELSKSGSGIHLHYIYEGDVKELERLYAPDIEIKVFTGNSALRRCLTKCNDIPIAKISSGLPLKGEKKRVLKGEQVRSERGLRELIKRCLRKEIHGHTKPEIDFIHHILEEAYASDLKYDVTDLRPSVQSLAISSTNNAMYCLKLVSSMKFKSEEPSENIDIYEKNSPIIFFDTEVFINLFIIAWKEQGKGKTVVRMINPTPQQVEELTKFKLVGFNNRRYDNHILYARMMGYTEKQLYNLSQRIIDGDKNAMFSEAYNLSYTDIYDFLSAGNKMSLKKWEIKLGIHHQELGIPWDQPIPESRWIEAADYCVNDVIATEAVWDYSSADWVAREILADISGLTVNDTTNKHTTRIIVGKDKHPQNQYIYTDLSTIFHGYRFDPYGIPKEEYIPGTKIVSGKSIYRGEDPGEGGYVYADPGVYTGVAVLDIASMHPHSAIKLLIFGEYYTMRFKELVDARIYIKHGDYDKAKKILDGKLAKYLDDPSMAKKLANALKTAINSVYGLTSAKFDNLLRDPRNVDNIVAKYGALFMINLKHRVQEKGFKVVHIKTDSIKIANATPEIIQFVVEYGEGYGYTFEHESTYRKMCLVNDAVYIAQYESIDICENVYGYVPDNNKSESLKWTATGTQFQVPYVFKTLFSHEPVEFEDMCETKSVSTAMYLDMNPGTDNPDYHFIGKVGQFCPIKPNCGGGILLRESDGKYNSVVGTKKSGKIAKGEPETYFWLESETVKELGLQDDIDISYYDHLADEAKDTISKYENFNDFISDDFSPAKNWLNVPESEEEEVPFY